MDVGHFEGCVQEFEGIVSLFESRREPRVQGGQATDRISRSDLERNHGVAQTASGEKR